MKQPLESLIESALSQRSAVFPLDDEQMFAFEAARRARGVEFRETSQQGADVTFYLSGHSRFTTGR